MDFYLVGLTLVLTILGISVTVTQSQRGGGGRGGRGGQCQINCDRTGTTQNVTCALDPESVEGPYYLPLHLLRQNIVEDRTGLPLTLHLIVVNSNTCERMQDVTVDIWHADATGLYSGFGSAVSATFLRGIQKTNHQGEVTFNTIFPGWYPGRCIHIHIEVYVGENLKHTGQLFFTPETLAAVQTVQPYASRSGTPNSNADDRIYKMSYGDETLFMNIEGSAAGGGLTGIMYIGIDPNINQNRMI